MSLENKFIKLRNDKNGNARFLINSYDLASILKLNNVRELEIEGLNIKKYRNDYLNSYVLKSFNLEQDLLLLQEKIQQFKILINRFPQKRIRIKNGSFEIQNERNKRWIIYTDNALNLFNKVELGLNLN